MIFMICVNLLRAASVADRLLSGFPLYRKNGLYSHCRRFHHRHVLIVANFGVPERSAKADGPWRRAMGTGWVRETLDHDYADAQRRGHPVTLLVTETTGALSPIRPRLASAW